MANVGPELCDKCKGLHYKTAPCIVRKPKMVVAFDYGREDMLAEVVGKIKADGGLEILSITHSPPKRPRGRPRIHPDRKAYKAEHERKRRSKAKEDKQNG